MFRVDAAELEVLRDRLQQRGQRPSVLMPAGRTDLMEAASIAEEYGSMCEAMYLVMATDRRVLNVEREVMRGALSVLSDGRVRTRHMESMLEHASKAAAEQGEDRRVQFVIEALRGDPVRAETTLLLCAAVAAADDRVTPEEHRLLNLLAAGLGIDETHSNAVLAKLASDLAG